MVSLWGSQKGDEPEAAAPSSPQEAESSGYVAPRESEADERTRLIPPPAHAYLSPDDPAVGFCCFSS
jgi:hypothetical protein